MTDDNGRDGGLFGLRSSRKGFSAWRLLELAAAAGFLYWLVGSLTRPDRVALGGDAARPGPVASAPVGLPVKPTQPAGPGFSDSRSLVPGAAGAPPTSPPSRFAPPAPLAPPALPAARATEPAAKAPVPDVPPSPARQVSIAANIPPPPAAQAIPAKADAACPPPEINVAPLPGGQTQIRIESPCRRGQDIGFVYDGVQIKRQLTANGSGLFVLDLFAGDRRSVDVTFVDGMRRVVPVIAADLDKVSKIAVRWRAPVNLDLHVFEHAAGAGQSGHVWHGASASPDAALKTRNASGLGRGFLSVYDDGQGDKVEVYTYVHGEKDAGATVAMALDHETRGSLPSEATCGQGPLAKVDFQVSMLSPRGQMARAAGSFKPARCNQPLAAVDRFDYALMPTISIRN